MHCNIKDIAKEAGVSHTTVSRILRNKEGFSYASETCEKVFNLAKSMGYTPNLAAQLMRLKESNFVGIAIQPASSYFSYILIKKLTDEISALSYTPVLIDLSKNDISYNAAANVRPDLLCGIISQYEGLTRKALSLLRNYDSEIPIVSLGDDEYSPGVRYVSSDHAEGIRKAINYLREGGHENICYTGHDGEHIKRSVSSQYSEKSGLSHSEFLVTYGKYPDSFAAAESLVEKILSAKGITAALCEDDEFAMGLISGFAKKGVRVPEEFSVIGYDDLPFAAYANPPLSTVRQNIPEIALQTAKLMISCIQANENQRDLLPQQIFVDTELVIRTSSGRKHI
ncbi:MAG: hypothetical protein A2017_13425 [Lentisphaerae bacterium GWF2_44_16]|nr:MAG: hypothetical protein A2017_13425 [Lentisphaerae bacterium GWF2_44_16]